MSPSWHAKPKRSFARRALFSFQFARIYFDTDNELKIAICIPILWLDMPVDTLPDRRWMAVVVDGVASLTGCGYKNDFAESRMSVAVSSKLISFSISWQFTAYKLLATRSLSIYISSLCRCIYLPGMDPVSNWQSPFNLYCHSVSLNSIN